MAFAQDWQAEWSVVQSCSQVYCLRQLAEVLQRYSFGVSLLASLPPPAEKVKLSGVNRGR